MNRFSLAALATVFLLSACQRQLSAPLAEPQLYPITAALDTIPSAAGTQEMEQTIASYSAQLEEVMSRVLAQVAAPLVKGQPESSLGNWTADLIAEAARDLFPDQPIAFAVQNYGGLRVGEIGIGPLIVSEIYELMPFDNELVLVEVTGTNLLDFVTHTLLDGGWPVSANLSAARRGQEVKVLLGGKPVDPTATYYIAVPDYVANGGDDSDMLVGKKQFPSGRMIRDLLIDYAGRSSTPISVGTDGSRIKIEDQ